MSKTCLLTNDVETTSIVNGGLRPETGFKVWKEGMPRLLDLYAKYNAPSTFFFVADFARECPDIVKMVQSYGHEVACHGLTHDYRQAFDMLSFDEQIDHLAAAKKILEDIAGNEVISFRAPALRVNKFTPKALIESGFRYDSSVAPQRMDMFMTLGSRNKLSWLNAPRQPYFVSENSLSRSGNTELIEVPVSSFGFPYIGTFMRVAPLFNRMTRYCLHAETLKSDKLVNFLIHPNELIEEIDLHLKSERRSKNYVSYLLSDVIRKKIKLKNLGVAAHHLYQSEIEYWYNNNYKFTRVCDIEI